MATLCKCVWITFDFLVQSESFQGTRTVGDRSRASASPIPTVVSLPGTGVRPRLIPTSRKGVTNDDEDYRNKSLCVVVRGLKIHRISLCILRVHNWGEFYQKRPASCDEEDLVISGIGPGLRGDVFAEILLDDISLVRITRALILADFRRLGLCGA